MLSSKNLEITDEKKKMQITPIVLIRDTHFGFITCSTQ